MSKPKGTDVAARAVELALGPKISYASCKCDAFVERCVNDCGGDMDTSGTNDMVRNHCAWLGTIENALTEEKVLPGAGLLIHEETEANLPAKYQGDGLGDFSHVALFVGENALIDVDKNGKAQQCNAVHSSYTMGWVAGTTLKSGYTHVILFPEIDYGLDVSELGLGAEVEAINGEPSEDAVQHIIPEAIDQGVVVTPNGGPANLRPQRKKDKLYWHVASGTCVLIERQRDGWSLITAVCTDGAERRAWMQSKYIKVCKG